MRDEAKERMQRNLVAEHLGYLYSVVGMSKAYDVYRLIWYRHAATWSITGKERRM